MQKQYKKAIPTQCKFNTLMIHFCSLFDFHFIACGSHLCAVHWPVRTFVLLRPQYDAKNACKCLNVCCWVLHSWCVWEWSGNSDFKCVFELTWPWAKSIQNEFKINAKAIQKRNVVDDEEGERNPVKCVEEKVVNKPWGYIERIELGSLLVSKMWKRKGQRTGS